MTDYTALEILSLGTSATVEDVKQAYKKLSHIMHPDKGGDIEEFKHLQKVYKNALDELRIRDADNKFAISLCSQ